MITVAETEISNSKYIDPIGYFSKKNNKPIVVATNRIPYIRTGCMFKTLRYENLFQYNSAQMNIIEEYS